MKTKNLILAMLTLSALVFNTNQANGQNTNAADSTRQDSSIYSCSMHPEIQSTFPAKCPKCGMDLVQKKSSSTEHKMDGMMMCPMHGMVNMSHKHDEQNKKPLNRMAIGMGGMMVVMMTIMLILIIGR